MRLERGGVQVGGVVLLILTRVAVHAGLTRQALGNARAALLSRHASRTRKYEETAPPTSTTRLLEELDHTRATQRAVARHRRNAPAAAFGGW